VAQPLVESWIRENLGPEAQARQIVVDGLSMVRALPTLVGRLERLVDELDRAGAPPSPSAERRDGRLWLVAAAALAAGLLLAKVV
jgi:ubiquinone biosynthesis protein